MVMIHINLRHLRGVCLSILVSIAIVMMTMNNTLTPPPTFHPFPTTLPQTQNYRIPQSPTTLTLTPTPTASSLIFDERWSIPQQDSTRDLHFANKPYYDKLDLWKKNNSDGDEQHVFVHVFYTIDCTQHSLWQAMVLEKSWEDVGHDGFLTRIVSGCTTEAEFERSRQSVLRQDSSSYRRHGVFFSPTFDVLPNGEAYAPYNRPNSFWYWMNVTSLPLDAVLINVDPDMIFMRTLHPFVTDSVRRGHPAGAEYHYMWPLDLTRAYHENKHKYTSSTSSSFRYDKSKFVVGPPWMMHRSDWLLTIGTWVDLIMYFRERAKKSKWIVEMVAFAAAAVVHELPFTVIHEGMVHSGFLGRFWRDRQATITASSALANNSLNAIFHTTPILLHYCYTYEIGAPKPNGEAEAIVSHQQMKHRDQIDGRPEMKYWHFSKYRVPSDWPNGRGVYSSNIFSCNDGPLLQEFPEPFSRFLETHVAPREWTTAFMMRFVMRKVNNVLVLWRQKYCDAEIVRHAKENGLWKSFRTTHFGFYISSKSNVSSLI
eukprot:PhM_4_TR8038/c0_g1_i1/m.45995/K20781/SGT1; peptidyl serine alpha-galactosyltransferase